jgi:hypothetical protein
MPFEKSFDDVYDAIRLSVKEATIGEDVVCRRLDDLKGAGRITEDLEREINEAIICIADVTGLNANVMWEVGYAMALGKPILLLTQNIDKLPFDLQPMRTIAYERSSLKLTLRTPLVDAFRNTLLDLKARINARRVPVKLKAGLTIAVTGSVDVDAHRVKRRLIAILQPYLSVDTNWMVGGSRGVDELAAEYLAEQGESIVVVTSNPYSVSQHSLEIVERFNLPLISADEESTLKGINAKSAREALFLTKADLVILLWNGNSPGIRGFIKWYTEQGKDFVLGFV